MKVSKNIYLGGLIEDLNELHRLALERKSVVILMGGKRYFVRPAAFLLGWPLSLILRSKIYYSVKDGDIVNVKFENTIP